MHDVLAVLRRPRIIGLAVLAVVLAVLFAYMSSWQRDRAGDEGARADKFTENVASDPVEVESVLDPGQPLDSDMDWRAAYASGTYDATAQVLVRNRGQYGENGMVVAAPLLTDDGTWLWVARGWFAAGSTADATLTAPSPPGGVVTVYGALRSSEVLDGELRPADVPPGQVTALAVPELSADLDGPAYGAVLQADLEEPAAAQTLTPVAPPTSVGGNLQNISYALQWAAFALIAIVGFGMVVRVEVRQMREAEAQRDPEPRN